MQWQSFGKMENWFLYSLTWEDGRKYNIDRILKIERCASRKAGGVGMMYTCMIQNRKEKVQRQPYNSVIKGGITMNDLVEQILELIKGKKTAIDMQAIMFQSRSTTYRKLKDEGTSISEIKNLYQDCGAFSVIRKKDDMSRRAFKEELSKFLLCDPDDVWKRFN